VKRGGFVDRLSMVLAVAGASVPGFWLGVLFILVFSVQLRWLPSTGVGGPPWTLDGLRHLVMPMVALAVGLLASTTRLTRSSMLDVLGEDYIRTAHSKGLRTWFVVMRHGLPNALIPIVTNIGLQAGALLGGALFIETVFAWPGLGRLGVDAMGRRDYPLIQGVVLLTMGVFATVNLVVDVLYARLDPRIRYR
jgi:ABC-type dipeptide/oligopeptide/nickel transport system permease component